MQSKMYINIWIFLLLVEVKLSKYADIQFVESETVMNYIWFSSVLWRIMYHLLSEGLHLIFKW